MPDAAGNFKGIVVPALPWLETDPAALTNYRKDIARQLIPVPAKPPCNYLESNCSECGGLVIDHECRSCGLTF